MSVAILYHPGLGTSLESDLCGAKPKLLALADAYQVHPIILKWDDPSCSQMLNLLVAANDFVFLIGHSHGAWRARENIGLLQYQSGKKAKVGVALIDECPFGNPFENLLPPQEFPRDAAVGFACWQNHCRWFMPNGVKFSPSEKPLVNVLDCTPLQGPALGHIQWRVPLLLDLESIAGDSRVWNAIGETFATLVPSSLFPQPAAVPLVGAGTDASGGAGGTQ